MSGINNRIKEIRQSKGLTQSQFSEIIGLSRNYIALIEIGERVPSDRTISDICREFNVNEEWLRTGEGEMFKPKSRNEELQEFLLRSVDDPSGIQVKLLSVMARLSTDQWELLRDIALQIAEEVQKEKADP